MPTAPPQNTYDQFADEYARSYVERDPSFHFNLDLAIPKLMEVAGNVDGLVVLDAGCGEGIVSRSLRGTARQVIGIDIVQRFVEIARERDTSGAIRYEWHDLCRPLPQYTNTFDLIVSNFVLNDVPDYRGFVRTLGSVLKPGGRLVLTTNNPYSMLLREKVDDYFASDAVAEYSFGPATYYHHTMEEFTTAFAEVGLLMRRIIDLHMTPAMVAGLPAKSRDFPWYSYYERYPFVLVLELIKAQEGSTLL